MIKSNNKKYCFKDTMYIKLQGDGTGGNRLFDGTVDQDTFDLHGTIDSSATFRDGFGSFTQCPGNSFIKL